MVIFGVFPSSSFSLPSGVEPWSFYFINGFLNFNVVFLLALSAAPLIEFRVSQSTNINIMILPSQ